MKNIKEYLPVVAIVLMILTMFSTCGTKGKIKSLKKEVTTLNTTVQKQDSIIANTISAEEIKLRLELEGLKVSKRILFDQNAIVRTTVRPDDQMNAYDKQIEAVRKKIDNLGK